MEFMELQWEVHGIGMKVNGNFMEFMELQWELHGIGIWKSMGASWNLWNSNDNFMELVYESQWELHEIGIWKSMGTSWNLWNFNGKFMGIHVKL